MSAATPNSSQPNEVVTPGTAPQPVSPEVVKRPSRWSQFVQALGEAIGQAKFGE